MHPVALVLVIVAAFCHAGWNLYAKKAADGGAVFVWLNSALSTVIYAPVAIGVLIIDPPEWNWMLPAALLVTGILHAAYSVSLQRGYRSGDMSVVYPLARGTGPALSVAFAVIVLGERPGLVGLLGAAVVIVGILVIGMGGSGGTGKLLAGVGYGLLTGFLIASYTVWDAVAVGALAVSPILLDWSSNVFRASLLTPYALRRRDEISRVWRVHRKPVLVVAFLAPIAYTLVLFAYWFAPVSFVAPARELSIVVGSVFAWLLLREPQAFRRITGAAVVLLGVVALAAAR